MTPLRIALVAGALLSAAPARAQGTPPPLPPAVEDLAPGDEVVVREYIIRRRPAPVRFEADFRLRPGSTVPAYVDLAPMADYPDPRLRRFAYFVSPDDKLVVVDPVTRAVVRILDR